MGLLRLSLADPSGIAAPPTGYLKLMFNLDGDLVSMDSAGDVHVLIKASGLELGDLSDVDVSGGIADGDVLAWNSGTSKFEPTAALTDALVFKGVIDCSTNPNYPAADAGHVYKVSVAGKIGGASGTNVEAGDSMYCITDSSISGDEATVGANWVIQQANLDGVVTGPASATDGYAVLWDGTTGKLVKAAGAAPVLTTGIGVSVQAYSATLAGIVGLSPSDDDFLQRKSGAWANRTIAQVRTDLQGDGSSAAASGFRGVPQNSQSAAYTCVLADAGKHILHPSADTTARVFTIPANSSVAYAIGTAITFVNQNAGGVITIAITTDTMRLAGAGTTGSRTLAANGIATAIKVTSTEWLISGVGLT